MRNIVRYSVVLCVSKLLEPHVISFGVSAGADNLPSL